MKHIIALILTAAVALSASAADNKTATDSAKEIFKAKEFSIESAYTVRTEDFDRYCESVTIGMNYFVTKGSGAHIGFAIDEFEFKEQGIDLLEFGYVGRIPIDKLRLALTYGVGAELRFVNDTGAKRGGYDKETGKKTSGSGAVEDKWAVYAEAGVLFRANDYFDLFAKIRGSRPIESSKGEHVGIFAGVNVPLRF